MITSSVDPNWVDCTLSDTGRDRQRLAVLAKQAQSDRGVTDRRRNGPTAGPLVVWSWPRP